MLGHGNNFGSKVMDELVLKGIQTDSLSEIIEFFYFHEFFMYYPHPNITREVLARLKADDENGDSLLYFLKSISRRSLIKLTPELLNEVMELKGTDKQAFLDEPANVNHYFENIEARYKD